MKQLPILMAALFLVSLSYLMAQPSETNLEAGIQILVSFSFAIIAIKFIQLHINVNK